MGVVNLDTERVRRIERAIDMPPDKLLSLVADDFARGEFNNPVALIVIVVDENADGGQTIKPYRAGVNAAEEIGYMEAWKRDRLDDWRC